MTEITTETVIPLGQLPLGGKGVVVSTSENLGISHRLLELGFVEGAEIEALHAAPLFRDPVLYKVAGTRVALRRADANSIRVEVLK